MFGFVRFFSQILVIQCDILLFAKAFKAADIELLHPKTFLNLLLRSFMVL